MKPKEILGKRITNLFVWVEMEVYGLDQGKVFVEIDYTTTIGIPSSFNTNILKNIDKKVVSLFEDLSDYPVYYVNKEGKTIQEVTKAINKRESGWMGTLKKQFRILPFLPKEYKPYKIEFVENKLKNLKYQIIIDVLFFEDPFEGFLLLENGYLITEISVAPHGTGDAGLKYYQSLQEFESAHGTEYKRLTTWLKEVY